MQLRYRLLYLFIAVGSLITAAGQQQYTLLECIEIALENNRDIKQQELNKQQRMVAYSQARADLLPAVNASAGHNFIFGRSIGLDNIYQNTNSSQSNFNIVADITLFDGLRMKHNIDARKADMMVSEANLERIQDEIIMSVSTAFLQALLNRELLTIAENQIQTTRENLKRSTELVNSGKMAKGELYEIEAQLAKEEVNRVQAENNYKLALLDLAQIMELEKFDDFEIVSPSAEALIDETPLLSSQMVYESVLVNRPEIRSLQYQLESSTKEMLMAKSQYFPTLSFGASMGTGYYNMNGRDNDPFATQLRNNISNSFGFSLRILIFNRF
jgi:outer membrane protein